MCKVSVIVPVYNVENYIYDMLTSVQEQTFKDFEVIMVDDGSTDDSPQIAGEFAARDGRFKYFRQENAGVSAARNFGIREASGDYMVFYDPDDLIPGRALEKMYKTAARAEADIIVGVMEEKNMGESVIYMNSQKLAKKRDISPLDENFIGAWSVCNKMFSSAFIRKNGLRFENIHNAEDGLFTFCALNCANRITGCDTVAYNYIRRPFWESASATQIVNRRYLEELLASHSRIMEEAGRLTNRMESQEEAQNYMRRLYFRFIDVEMIGFFYRRIWKAEAGTIDLLIEKIKEYKERLTEKQWKGLADKNPDLELDKGFMTAEDMADDPVVSVILWPRESGTDLSMAVQALYNQSFPRFEVIARKDLRIPLYEKMPNFRALDRAGSFDELIAEARGRYILILDSDVMCSKNSLRNMAGRMEKDRRLDFVTMLMRTWDGVTIRPIPVIDAGYGFSARKKKGDKLLSCWDLFMANKLFRKEAVDWQAPDMAKIRKALNYANLRKGAMVTTLDEADLESLAGKEPPAAAVKLMGLGNRLAAGALRCAKRRVTREDIQKIKKMLRR